MTASPIELFLLGLAALAAGIVNALAGGGSIFTFPALIAAGVPPVAANITNTIALCPGYVGGVIGQWRDLKGQWGRLALLAPITLAGGLFGGWLLLYTSDKIFATLVPALVIGACVLLGVQDRVRALLQRRSGGALGIGWAMLPVGIAAIYGGYFGAGLSVIFLAVLGIALEDTLTRLNALKQALGFAANIPAVLLFANSDRVVWSAAAVMAVGAIAGGAIGGRFASMIRPTTLRRIVIAVGILVAVAFIIR